MVRHVVEHGQCISENSIVHTAVTHVQPFCTNSVCSAERSFISTRLPVERYAMMMMGTTISLAGKPRINASRITPSRPKKRAAGPKNAALLRSGGYLTNERSGCLRLTEKGSQAGAYLLYRHDVLNRLLRRINGSADELEQTERIEHYIDVRTVRNIDAFLDGLPAR